MTRMTNQNELILLLTTDLTDFTDFREFSYFRCFRNLTYIPKYTKRIRFRKLVPWYFRVFSNFPMFWKSKDLSSLEKVGICEDLD